MEIAKMSEIPGSREKKSFLFIEKLTIFGQFVQIRHQNNFLNFSEKWGNRGELHSFLS
jgi:hypothetical protein